METARATSRPGAILGFALLWAVGKACVNQNAFAYPHGGAGLSPTFALYLLVVTVVAALLCFLPLKRLLAARPPLICAAVATSFGFTLLMSLPQVPWGFVGSVFAGCGLTLLNIAYLRLFMAETASCPPFALIAAVFAGDVLAGCLSASLPFQVKAYLFSACPLVAAAAIEPPGPAEHQPSARPRLDSVATPFLGFAAFTLVSISVSHLFMNQGSLSPSAHTAVHVIAPLTGVLTFFVLSLARKHNVSLVVPVFLVTAFALLPIPFLGDWYLGPVKVLTLAASETLFLSTATACAESTTEYGIDDHVLPAATLMLLNGFTLLGALVGTVYVSLGDVFATASHLIVEAASFLLLLITTFLIRASESARQNDAAISVNAQEPASAEDAVRNAARLYALTLREQEVLLHLLLHKTPLEIARELFLAPETVRGHIKNIYRKADVHSRDELVLKARETQGNPS